MKLTCVVLLALAAISACAGNVLPREVTITQVTLPMGLTEGPHWDADKGVLFFVDIYGYRLYQFDPITDQLTFVDVDGALGFAIPVAEPAGRFIAGRDHSVIYIDWTGDANVTLAYDAVEVIDSADLEDNQGGNRFNDAKADITGRLWAGTMEVDASLYSLATSSKNLVQEISGVQISNGIAWNADNTVMYWIDTPTNNVFAFDFDAVTGAISGRRSVLDVATLGLDGSPDGMTIDTDDNLWVALWGGHSVIHIDPRSPNQLLQQIVMPASQVSSVQFGGADFTTLYVTTANLGLSEEQLALEPLAGSVFKVEGLGVTGRRANTVKRDV